MGRIARLSVIGVALFLAGCQGHHGYWRGLHGPYSVRIATCPGQTCATIDVDLSAGCPTREFDTVEFAGGRGERTLQWKIVNGPDWQFSQDPAFPAIHFTTKSGAPIPIGRVGRARFPGSDGKTLVLPWDRKGDGTGDERLSSFEYVLNLVGPRGTTCTIDPWIVDR